MKRVSCASFTFCTWTDCFHSVVNNFFIKSGNVNYLSPFIERNLMERNSWFGGDRRETGFMRLFYLFVFGRMARLIRKQFVPFLDSNDALSMREILIERNLRFGGDHGEAGFMCLFYLFVFGRMARLIRKQFVPLYLDG